MVVTSIEAKKKFTGDVSTVLMLHKEKMENTLYIDCFLNNFHTILIKQYNSEQVTKIFFFYFYITLFIKILIV